MVRIAPFAVEEWMDEYENTPGCLNIAETCAASVSIDELVALARSPNVKNAQGEEGKAVPGPVEAAFTSTKLTYGAIRGSEALRRNVASLHETELPSATTTTPLQTLSPDDILITQGAIAANFLALYTLVGPGDHVICVYPTYQQLYSVPASLGAEVSLWKLKAENAFIPDVAELEALVKPNTKMIILNNPNNPTGAPIPLGTLTEIVAFARVRNITILSDEVYRPLFHSLPSDDTPPPPGITALGYQNVIATGSMSKAYALAGLRIGWLATPSRALLDACASARHYTTISVSALDDRVASYALSPAVRPALLRRNLDLARTNRALLAGFVGRHAAVCDWVAPLAGTTAFVRFRHRDGDGGGTGRGGRPVDDVAFCRDVLDRSGVFFVPGSRCFGDGSDFAGYVRIGYVSSTQVLQEALGKLDAYIEAHLS
ncbi:aspartate aminotransferase [Sodiomyces alkalinus F11]|uniref:Aspartate aminotransferase n=1 Tax=Sodiomyces alkalinus (strain CBS 110278 / VKM F-3762 / F11) TaxID=1314773 RepID=A0A3N2PPR0_SODAK|nr:aspartate aminotransferase [Sodiomyces alkalinus F11]ROT36346.1 aspartate aminotransferase [Sodiomyces alkalinus F11]